MEKIDKLMAFLRENPKDAFLLHALALEYIKLKEDQKAQETFEQLLSDNPGYVGSYYHLGKIFENRGDNDNAIKIYEQGMTVAKAANDRHAYGELRSAYEELSFD